MKRPQPYRLSWTNQLKLPEAANTLLARLFSNADQMFEILYRDFGNPAATTKDVTDRLAAFAALVPTLGYWTPLVTGGLPGELIFDGDGDVIMVWVPTS